MPSRRARARAPRLSASAQGTAAAALRLIFLSGLSGSGKSVALHMLEDLDFYCIDNIPAALLRSFISHTVRSASPVYQRTAVGIDARNPDDEIATVPMLLDELRRSGIQCELLFLVANDEELLRRFAETRRKHPLSRQGESLHEAIAIERALLEPLINAADLVVDTSRMGVHELRELIHHRVGERHRDQMSLWCESFGFKHGIPGDADFVFDARSLPNPYWEPNLRPLTGRDAAVVHFLEAQPAVGRFIDDVAQFIEARIPEHQAANRRYLTIAVGCTGGQHRSVYIVEQLAARLAAHWPKVAVRHAALPDLAPAAATP
jgi:RNase adapter protein RapZ